ncbi:MAG: transporter [Caldisericia bacterium]|nr:transporter [Caldisericia bacterium]MDD4614110.1 transporter [Caldisericia bacterium]
MIRHHKFSVKRFSHDFFFLHFSLFLFSLSGIFAKLASNHSLSSFHFYLLYGIEFVLLIVYAVLWQQVLKKMDLSIAYANRGAIFLWTFMGSLFLFDETISLYNIVGAVVISIGIYIVFQNHD